MSNNTLKTSYRELQDHLRAISEIPERVNRCDEVLKKELLEHIDNRIQDVLGTINGVLMVNSDYNYPNEYLPNRQFEYWAERVNQEFNYYQFVRLREFILNSIEVRAVRNKHERHFFETGLDAFDYLNTHFTDKDRALTTKYTILYHFLRYKNLIRATAVEYQSFVREYTSLPQKFSRLNFDNSDNPIYLTHERHLIELYKEFLSLQNK
ncbi:hypothetical protein M0G43_01670 [Subsaxibacter sp. CAU 1640]|uniref:hypothetical protein n=1 Tax=Subsaxibacter sp. CAU 1640 TaxID=2933271 RepID=UPI0020059343|nr:hypothetical protein [Subsaxibacter sp. CAU 1640]MCK7589273.1 hypothetical protein [Subsaxibacter sp. CAU 1640]